MTLSVKDLRDKYGLFSDGDFGAIANLFTSDAQYRQLDSGQVALGREQIQGVMEGWRHFFGDSPRIENITIREAHALADEVEGAEQCFVVDFEGVGVYTNTFPGLEQVAPAQGQDVRVPIGETVWVNAAGEFIRVDSTMNISALK